MLESGLSMTVAEREKEIVISALHNCHKTCIGAGVVVGLIWLVLGIPELAIVPAYVIIAFGIINFLLRKGFFKISIHSTAIAGIIIPIAFSAQVGGIEKSGGVMMYSIAVLITLTTFLDVKKGFIYSGLLVILIIVSFVFDDFLKQNPFTVLPDKYVSILFLQNLVVNIVYAFVIIMSYIKTQKRLISELSETYVSLLNSQKLSALGQISAGIAHEVNTPLGAINSYSEETEHVLNEVLSDLPSIISLMSDEELNHFRNLLNTKRLTGLLTTKEERAKKRMLETDLEVLDVMDAKYLSSKLVQSGIYAISDEIKALLSSQNSNKIIIALTSLITLKNNNKNTQLAVQKASRVVRALKIYLHSEDDQASNNINIEDNIDIVLTIYQNMLKQGIEVIKNYSEVPLIIGNQEKLNQVWTNLIYNAIQAMDNKGKLTISMYMDNGEVIVSIADTGCGMSEDVQNRIFEPFFTTKKVGEGSGLGLDIISKIIEEHEGDIWFESEKDVGSIFYVKFKNIIK